MTDALTRLQDTISLRRAASPDSSYVASLFAKGRAEMAQKLGEEAVETVIAALSGDAAKLTSEAADLLFHLVIVLAEGGVTVADVTAELRRREGVSGIAEKNARND